MVVVIEALAYPDLTSRSVVLAKEFTIVVMSDVAARLSIQLSAL